MKSSFSISERKPIWMALSEFYLDTELSENELKNIAILFKNSPYTFEEIKVINKYEVYPILYQNLLNMYGVWNGFDQTWLIESIIARINKKSRLNKKMVEITYYVFGGKSIIDWNKVQKIYNELN